jgi:hypothetical protein
MSEHCSIILQALTLLCQWNNHNPVLVQTVAYFHL